MESQRQSGVDVQAHLIGRAATDEGFRKRLLTDSRATVEKELGIELPPGLEVQVIEETPSRLCLVLPMMQETQGNLSSADLEHVVGGIDTVPLPEKPAVFGRMPLYSFSRLSTYRR